MTNSIQMTYSEKRKYIYKHFHILCMKYKQT